MKSTRMYVRVEDTELTEWKAVAAEEGKLLSEWVREICNAVAEHYRKSNPVKPDVIREEPVKSTQKTCTHGVAKGYACWQCGGLAETK